MGFLQQNRLPVVAWFVNGLLSCPTDNLIDMTRVIVFELFQRKQNLRWQPEKQNLKLLELLREGEKLYNAELLKPERWMDVISSVVVLEVKYFIGSGCTMLRALAFHQAFCSYTPSYNNFYKALMISFTSLHLIQILRWLSLRTYYVLRHKLNNIDDATIIIDSIPSFWETYYWMTNPYFALAINLAKLDPISQNWWGLVSFGPALWFVNKR